MSLFSQRKGLKPVKSVIQVDTVDFELRNGLWDMFRIYCWPEDDRIHIKYSQRTYNFCFSLWHAYFKQPIDSVNDRPAYRVLEILRRDFFDCE